MKLDIVTISWTILLFSAFMTLAGCASTRPGEPPPSDKSYVLPWGAVPIETWDSAVESSLKQELSDGINIRAKTQKALQTDPEKPVAYRMLALSGGGAWGAYGAGVLTGWTAAGTRPEFDVVTGVSTGAMMATFAFLGSEYDDALYRYKKLRSEDIFKPRFGLSKLFSDALNDTAPLRKLIAKLIDESVLEAVAREHAKGRRLFIGTTNLDAGAFTVWNMGGIASSNRPDKLERYREITLASTSVPLVFPPVYFPVEADGESYWQMHVDGGARETVFFYDAVEEVIKAYAAAGLDISDVHGEVYVINNRPIYAKTTYEAVEPRTLSIAKASIGSLMRKNVVSSLYRLWVQALIYEMDFHLAYIPPDFKLSDNPINFDQDEMQRLFELGYNKSINGKAWDSQRATTDYTKLIDLLDPMETLDELEARPMFRRRVK